MSIINPLTDGNDDKTPQSETTVLICFGLKYNVYIPNSENLDDSNFRSKFGAIHETGVLEINSISSATNDDVMHKLINQKSEI